MLALEDLYRWFNLVALGQADILKCPTFEPPKFEETKVKLDVVVAGDIITAPPASPAPAPSGRPKPSGGKAKTTRPKRSRSDPPAPEKSDESSMPPLLPPSVADEIIATDPTVALAATSDGGERWLFKDGKPLAILTSQPVQQALPPLTIPEPIRHADGGEAVHATQVKTYRDAAATKAAASEVPKPPAKQAARPAAGTGQPKRVARSAAWKAAQAAGKSVVATDKPGQAKTGHNKSAKGSVNQRKGGQKVSGTPARK
jgi:hypothetical protein